MKNEQCVMNNGRALIIIHYTLFILHYLTGWPFSNVATKRSPSAK